MVKRQTNFIAYESEIEVVKYEIKTNKFIAIKEMIYEDYIKFKKQKGFRYQGFQKGFSQYK